jgi:hypothetical protein
MVFCEIHKKENSMILFDLLDDLLVLDDELLVRVFHDLRIYFEVIDELQVDETHEGLNLILKICFDECELDRGLDKLILEKKKQKNLNLLILKKLMKYQFLI